MAFAVAEASLSWAWLLLPFMLVHRYNHVHVVL